jgi:hypothetical protein
MNVWRGIRGLADQTPLVQVAGKLATVGLSASDQRLIICEAHVFASAETWTAFKSEAEKAALAESARAALTDPATCN